MSGFLDRTYSAEEVAAIGARASHAIDTVPTVVKIAAHLAAAFAILKAADQVDPRGLPADFRKATRLLAAVTELFLLVCKAGPVSGAKVRNEPPTARADA